jgi:adenine deaminase
MASSESRRDGRARLRRDALRRARAFIGALPKAELHLHLEGAVPWDIVRASSPDPLVAAPPWWADDFRFEDFTQFRQASRVCFQHALTRPETYSSSAAAIFAGLAAQNVRYVEISFDARRVARSGLSFVDAVGAIKKAECQGLIVRVFGAFSRHRHDETSDSEIQALLETDGLDGIDLHGDESLPTAPRFAAAFAEARRRGLGTKAHAGELAGPSSVRVALDVLGVSRIEHGLRAVEDESLLARLVREAITLDMCPWSNVKLGLCPDLRAHPIRRLHDRGVRVTASTDDPTIFGHTLNDELVALVEVAGFSLREIVALQADAFRAARLTATERTAALDELRAVVARLSS